MAEKFVNNFDAGSKNFLKERSYSIHLIKKGRNIFIFHKKEVKSRSPRGRLNNPALFIQIRHAILKSQKLPTLYGLMIFKSSTKKWLNFDCH